MLLDRAAGLADKINKYQTLKKAGDEALLFQSRANQLKTASEKLSSVRKALRKMRDAGIEIDFVPSDGLTLAERAKDLRIAMSGNPSAINDPALNLKYDFLDRLASVATAADRMISASWKSYVRKRAEFGSSDILDALAAIPQFRPSVIRIRQCRTALEAFGETVPEDPKATVLRLDALVAEHEKSWSELSANDIPPSVVKFIRDAANDGASLTSYSDEVRHWLDKQNLVASFRIRLK
ncbi:hypothetical protein MRBLRH8O_003813 [Agrobacterium radiobacter]|uniref:hypothetical protein n=1 Tax=Agrobacterium radiobacter TaxID=362 RepID=UPI0034670244